MIYNDCFAFDERYGCQYKGSYLNSVFCDCTNCKYYRNKVDLLEEYKNCSKNYVVDINKKKKEVFGEKQYSFLGGS